MTDAESSRHDPRVQEPLPTRGEQPPEEVVLVSACLLGRNCRYNAEVRSNDQIVAQQQTQLRRLVPICPEASLGTPRPAADIYKDVEGGTSATMSAVRGEGKDVLEGRGRVLTAEGTDVTAAFVAGAEEALAIAQRLGARRAILKSRSPSCGCGELSGGASADGCSRRSGNGVTAELLLRHGIAVESAEFSPLQSSPRSAGPAEGGQP